jgi:hypothetical protein
MNLRPALALMVVTLQPQGLSRRLEKLLIITLQEAIIMSNYFDLCERHAKLYKYIEKCGRIAVLLNFLWQHQYIIGATAPIGEDTQTFYNFKTFKDFLNVCSANILVLTGLQHQFIGAVQGESTCLQHHAYLVKRCLFSQLE